MVELDIRGKVCPAATSDVYATLGRLPPGETLVVFTDYPPTRQTVPALAEQFGCQSKILDEGEERFRIVIRKPAAATPA